jgi:hypothetical protein
LSTNEERNGMKRLTPIAAILICFSLLFASAPFAFASGGDPIWTQTTEADFAAGTPDNVDTSTSPGNVILSLIANPTLITSDNTEQSVSGTTPTLVKTLTFTKSGASYDELRIDSNLRIDSTSGNKIAYSDIHVDDVSQFTHNTQSATYVSYQDTLDFSAYADGEHTIKLYLYAQTSASPCLTF